MWLVFERRVDGARVAAQLVGADGDYHFSLNVREKSGYLKFPRFLQNLLAHPIV
jgi:hypothetical protein